MSSIRKKIVTDENMQPVAVLIDYADWLEIERILDLGNEKPNKADFSDLYGIISFPEDPIEYQRRCRGDSEVEEIEDPPLFDPSEFVGSIRLTEDPLEYQRRVREEWD